MNEQKSYATVLSIQTANADPKGKKKNPAEFIILSPERFTGAVAQAKKKGMNIVQHVLGGKFDTQKQTILAGLVKGKADQHNKNVEEHKELMHHAGYRRFIARQGVNGNLTIFAECPGALVEVDGEEKIVHADNCPGVVAIKWANFRERFRNDDCNNIMKKKVSSKSGGNPDVARVNALQEDYDTLMDLGMEIEAAKIMAQIDKTKDKIARKALEGATVVDTSDEDNAIADALRANEDDVEDNT